MSSTILKAVYRADDRKNNDNLVDVIKSGMRDLKDGRELQI